MTLDEVQVLETAMKAEGSPYKDRMVSFDAIGDDTNNRAVNLVAHYSERETRQGKTDAETRAIKDFARAPLGRELLDSEVIIRAIAMPKSTGRFAGL